MYNLNTLLIRGTLKHLEVGTTKIQIYVKKNEGVKIQNRQL